MRGYGGVTMVRLANDESRERKIALFFLLSGSSTAGLTRHDIEARLYVDHAIEGRINPERIPAYQGDDETRRRKFERDKDALAQLGIVIDAVTDNNETRYRINPTSYYATNLSFNADERRVIDQALAIAGGTERLQAVFRSAREGMTDSADAMYQTLGLALLNNRVITFKYPGKIKERELQVLRLVVVRGALYVVGYDLAKTEIRGFKLSRMKTVPRIVAVEPPRRNEADMQAASRWQPEPEVAQESVRFTLDVPSAFATLIENRFYCAGVERRDGERAVVDLAFPSLTDARRVLLNWSVDYSFASTKKDGSTVRDEVRAWLKNVNVPVDVDVSTVSFTAAGPVRADMVSLTLAIIAVCIDAGHPLAVSEIGSRVGLDPQVVRAILGTAIESTNPWTDSAKDRNTTLNIEVAENANDENDPLYEVTFRSSTSLTAYSYGDIVALSYYVPQVASMFKDPVIESVRDKLAQYWHGMFDVIEEKTENGAIINASLGRLMTVGYWTESTASASVRRVVPVSVSSHAGHAYVRVYELTETGSQWRTFRLSRITTIHAIDNATFDAPADPDPHWLEGLGAGGQPVTVLVQNSARYLFEVLPGVTWGQTSDGRDVARFSASSRSFLDRLMVEAGAGASIIDGENREAGRELAAQIRKRI